jgi:arsenite methyltransferase
MASQPIDIAEMRADDIRDEVRKHYGARAATRTSCCGPTDGSDACCGGSAEAVTLDSTLGYSPNELQDIDPDAAGFSLGCGNPTAIAGMQAGEVVLDLGSGGGLDVFLAARQVGANGFVYGVDMTDEMLELARRNAAKMGVTNVEFRKGHIEDIPLPDATVDVIISNCVINLSPDKGETLREAFRVLKPGGRLAVSDIVIDGDLDDLPVSEAQVRTALSWAGCIAGALTIDQFKTLLADAGFEDIRIDIRQRYSLEALGQSLEEAAQQLPADVVEKLVNRFTSSTIEARRPA